MSTNATIEKYVKAMPLGKPFANNKALKLSSRASVDKSLSRLVEAGCLVRITNGVYMRPKINRHVGVVMTNIEEIAEIIAKSNGETLQVHGPEAVCRFKLSTQVPAAAVYYTSGSSREISVGKRKIKFIHTTTRRLQLAGTKAGAALSALWFLGQKGISQEITESVCNSLESKELESLLEANMPAWLASGVKQYAADQAHD
jgi:hypothetical protein